MTTYIINNREKLELLPNVLISYPFEGKFIEIKGGAILEGFVVYDVRMIIAPDFKIFDLKVPKDLKSG